MSINEIAEIAGQKHLDFLMFSDHNTLKPKRDGCEGWHNHVLVIIGTELNDRDDRNHYLAFKVNEEIENREYAKEYVRKVRSLKGFGVIAHPAEKRDFSDAYPPYPWTDWDVDEFDGIEIWNQMSEWMEGVNRRNFLWRILHPLRSIRFPVWETLERWDVLNRNRRVVGIGGIDVHAFQYKLFGIIPVELYPYKVQFKSIRSHLLIKNPIVHGKNRIPFKEAEDIFFEALTSARLYVSNYSVGDARGFQFWIDALGNRHEMGERIQLNSSFDVHVKAPLPGKIRLLCDGKVILRKVGDALEYTAHMPGVYRVEIYRKRRGWIYSNPIVVLENSN